MSRVGKNPIMLGKAVQAKVDGNNVVLKGPKAEMAHKLVPGLSVRVEGENLLVERANESIETRAFHGMMRALIQNSVTGLTRGWTKELELNGVGYRAALSGKVLELNLGYSHPIQYEIPVGIEIKIDKQTKLSVTGASRELVGQVAAKIRSFRPPEPFLGKGVKYADEKLRRKAGKSAGK